MKKHLTKIIIIALVILLAVIGIIASTHYGLLPDQIAHKLSILSQYKIAAKTSNTDAIPPLMMKQIEDGLDNEEVRICFDAKIKNEYDSLDEESKAYCNEHREKVDSLIKAYNSTPAKNISCEIKVPFIVDGCQGEACGERVGKTSSKERKIYSEILNGNELGSLPPNEKVEITSFKILVKKIGKARATSKVSPEMLEHGINRGSTFNLLHYIGEGWVQACDGKETFALEDSFQTISPYEAENWIYIKTKNVSGYIHYADLDLY